MELTPEFVLNDAQALSSQEDREFLRDKKNHHKWQEILLELYETLQSDLKKHENEAQSIIEEYKDISDNPVGYTLNRRIKSLRRLVYLVEVRIAEVERLIYMSSDEFQHNEMVYFFRTSIINHMKAKQGKGDCADEVLWAAAFGEIC